MLRSGRPVHVADRAVQHDLMGCSLVRALPQKLAMQELARNIKFQTVFISYVHWARQFKQYWSRQSMPSYIGCALSRCTRVHIKYFNHVATHELCCCWLLDGSEVRLRCTGNRLQRRITCVF